MAEHIYTFRETPSKTAQWCARYCRRDACQEMPDTCLRPGQGKLAENRCARTALEEPPPSNRLNDRAIHSMRHHVRLLDEARAVHRHPLHKLFQDVFGLVAIAPHPNARCAIDVKPVVRPAHGESSSELLSSHGNTRRYRGSLTRLNGRSCSHSGIGNSTIDDLKDELSI